MATISSILRDFEEKRKLIRSTVFPGLKTPIREVPLLTGSTKWPKKSIRLKFGDQLLKGVFLQVGEDLGPLGLVHLGLTHFIATLTSFH